MNGRHRYILTGLSLLLLLVIVTAVCIGAVHIRVDQLWSMVTFHSGMSSHAVFTTQQLQYCLICACQELFWG